MLLKYSTTEQHSQSRFHTFKGTFFFFFFCHIEAVLFLLFSRSKETGHHDLTFYLVTAPGPSARFLVRGRI